MTGALAAAYHSGAQRARVVTESWGESNLYCPNCSSPKLIWLEPGHPASDYSCPQCKFWYQLKSQRAPIRNSINDGQYDTMVKAIQSDEAPSMYFMQYDLATWRVRNLLLVPHFAFPPSAIIKRKPTQPKGRSKPWVGCNFNLSRVPADARIPVVTESNISPESEVREKFRRVKPLKDISVKERGWTLDVLNAVRRLGKAEFTTTDAYVFTRELEKLHPDNSHVRDKIRQQLQVLRDAGLLIHVERGLWHLP